MKKLLIAAAVVLIAIITSSVAMAAGTNTLTVNATVVGTCGFNSATSIISFTLDPSSSADATATTIPTFWCTRGTTVTAVTNNGLNFSGGSKRMKSTANPTEFIPYSIAMTPGSTTGSGKGTPINLTVTGTVFNANYINALAVNDYTDTVVITITP